jgi:predicted PurR-regulated permease PerM
MTEALDEASQRLGRYLLLQFAVNAGYGLLFGLGVYFIGISHTLLWGVFGFLLRFVPYVGTPVAAAFPMGLALAVFLGWSQVVLTCALFLLLELTIANLVEPWLYGSHTGISSPLQYSSLQSAGVCFGGLSDSYCPPLSRCA